ncbi:MAG: hypothetical protein GY828_04830 [Candidatus Gracilibacteria bacterium]|nr:hypothetical protein [Candidatus Gracilibacteria bacterium]
MKKRKTISEESKTKLYMVVVILVIVSIAFRLTNDIGLEQSSILFIGLPALITVLVIRFSKRPKRLYGMMARVVTLFLLMSSILFGEGVPCIILASPLFYGVGALIIWIYNMTNKSNKMYSYAAIPIILLLVSDPQKFQSSEVHKVSTTIKVDGVKSLSVFNEKPDFMKNYPLYFKRIGFPKPVDIRTNGLEVGDSISIDFLSDTRGMGTLSLRVHEVNQNKIIFDIPHDDTHIHHWLTWKKVVVELSPKEGNTEITWTSEFTCDLGPSWYFLPIEKYTVDVMNEHLINTYFKGNI